MPFSSHPYCQLWGCFPINIDCTSLKICIQASFWKLNSNPAKNYNIALQCNVFMPCCWLDSWLRCQIYFPGNTNFFPLFVHFGQWKIISPSNTIMSSFFLTCLHYFTIESPIPVYESLVLSTFLLKFQKKIFCCAVTKYVRNQLNDHRIRISLSISKIFLEKLSDMLGFLI